MRLFDTKAFRRTILSERPDFTVAIGLLADYRLMLGAVLETMVERFERVASPASASSAMHPSRPFIDMKFSLLDGKDFDPSDPIRGPGTIYGWIQGRALEALAGHYRWLERNEDVDADGKQQLLKRVRAMLQVVLENMEAIRSANGGRLFFMMDTQGHARAVGADGQLVPHSIAPDAPPTMSELFYVKGLLAAANLLGDQARVQLACEWFDRICQSIQADRFTSDQQSLDPANVAIGVVPGRHGHGSRMIGLGAAAVFLELTGEKKYQEMGFAFLDYILQRHVAQPPSAVQSHPYDMWEFTDEQGHPWVKDGVLLSDSGHATEMVGLALKFLRAATQRGTLQPADKPRCDAYYRLLPQVLLQNFANGFSADGLGIVKAYDLIGRKVFNADMPWWPLPETIRAAIGCAAIVSDHQRRAYLDIARRCSNAFIGHFVRPDLMAYQTINASGQPVPVVPATPDADPGYHTGLSIIDALNMAEEMVRQMMGDSE